MQLLFIQFSSISFYFLPLRPIRLPQHSVPEHPQPVFFLLRRGQGLHLIITTRKIIILCIFMPVLSNGKEQDSVPSEFKLLLVSSFMQL